MPRGRLRLTLGLALFLAVAVAAIAVGGPAALVLGPAVVLALPFLVDRYPGEAVLGRLARRRAPRRRTADAPRRPRAPRTLGRRLAPLASFGASRAPPALALT